MKHLFFIVFLLSINFAFSQQKVINTLDSKVENISILSFGLDNITIINSESNQIEIELLDENSKDHQIVFNRLGSSFKISFKLQPIEAKKEVFRKFITKRLNRVSAIVKVPQNKSITVFGKDIDIISKSYQGNLKIYIDKGKVQLKTIQHEAEIRLFNGNVFATISNATIDIVSNNGTILVNDTKYNKSYKKETSISKKLLKVSSINANVKLEVK